VHSSGTDRHEAFVVKRRHDLRLRRFHHVLAATDLRALI
jgi:hypothetical protein